jgi:hypothetical protein
VHDRSWEEFFSSTVLVLVAVALGVFLPVCARAQVSGATLSGTVSDASGAVIASVQVSISNGATGEVRTVRVDSAGFYSAPNLLPGTYDVSVSAPGFATTVQRGVKRSISSSKSGRSTKRLS